MMHPSIIQTPCHTPRAGSLAAILATGLALAAPLTAAQAGATSSEPLELSGSVAVGAEYNDNLSIAQLERAAGAGDTAATVDGNLNLRWQAAPQVTVEGGYSYNMSRYQDLDAFDLDLHLLFTDVAWEVAGLTLGGNYYFATADLGGDSFLDLNQYSLYAGKLFSDAWYLRGALNFSDKDFDRFNERDASNDGFGLDLYHFFNQGRSNVMLGYVYEDEDTRGPSFDYTADTLRLRLSHRFMLASREATLQLGYRLQDRDYANPTPLIGRPRDDRQQVVDARLEVNLVGDLAFVTRWERGNYDSFLPSADFTDNRVSAQLKYAF